MSRVQPLRGAEGALDILICSEESVAVAIDGFSRTLLGVLTKIILPPGLLRPFQPNAQYCQ
jgi:hypothetical protein